MNIELNKISSWIQANKLSLNVGKSVYLLFKGKREILEVPQLKIFNQVITRKTDAKFLGIHIDDNLNWKIHAQYVSAKVARMIGILYKLRSNLTMQALRTLYLSMVHPHLRYGLIFWGAAPKVNLNPIIVQQKKLIRLINHAGYIEHSEPLFRKSYILKFEDLIENEMIKFIFRDLLPSNEHFNFTYRTSIHGHNARNQSSLNLPQPRTALLRDSVFFRGLALFNGVPLHIRTAPSLNSFKYQLKNLYIECYVNSS